MSKLIEITHEDALIANKVNFFANYYQFVVSQLGRNSLYEIENILSLVEKIELQLESNFEYSLPYLKVYIANPLLNSGSKYLLAFQSYVEFAQLVNEAKLNGSRNWLVLNQSRFLSAAHAFKLELQQRMFNRAISEIVSFLKCEHEINVHIEALEYWTHLISVELLLRKKSKASIREVFDRIMSRDIREFPFRPEFAKYDPDAIEEQKRKFIETRTFDQQFEGIANYLEETQPRNFYIFRIGNIVSDESYEWAFGEVTFYTHNHEQIEKLKIAFQSDGNKWKRPFFEKHFGMYAVVQTDGASDEENFRTALDKVILWLDYINVTWSSSCFVDKNTHAYTSDFKSFGGRRSFDGPEHRISPFNAIELNATSVVIYLSNKDAIAKEDFLSHEIAFIKAEKSKNPADYWIYLENLLGKPFKDKLALIVSPTMRRHERDALGDYLFNCFSPFNNDAAKFGLSVERHSRLFGEMYKAFDYLKIRDEIKNDFVCNLIDRWSTSGKHDNTAYTLRVLNDLYAHRNFCLHVGVTIEKLRHKLEGSVNTIVTLFRQRIVQEMVNAPHERFSVIVDRLTKDDSL